MEGISIIIPVYNSGHYLREAVESVNVQNLTAPYEIIIVDDGSTDLVTRRALMDLAEGQNVTIIKHCNNKGAPAARNTAIRQAKYDFIFPLDSDDRIATPNETLGGVSFIQRAYDLLIADPNLDVVYSDVHMFGNGDKTYRFPPFSEKNFLERCSIWINGMHRKETSLQMGGYDETLDGVEDFAYWARMIQFVNESKNRSLKVKNTEDASYEYRKYERAPVVDHVTGWRHLIHRFPDLYGTHYPDIDLDKLPLWFSFREAQRAKGKIEIDLGEKFQIVASNQNVFARAPVAPCRQLLRILDAAK